MARMSIVEDGRGNVVSSEPMPDDPVRDRKMQAHRACREFVDQYRANPAGLTQRQFADAIMGLIVLARLDA